MKFTILNYDEVKIGRTKYRLVSNLTNTMIVELNSERMQFSKLTGDFVESRSNRMARTLPLAIKKF